jgi:hypothetical protein
VKETAIIVPKEYDPFWKVKQTDRDVGSAISIVQRKLDANKRAEILGETTFKAEKHKLESKFSTGEATLAEKMVESTRDNLSGTKHLLVDIPFKSDAKKVQRFKNYIEQIENNMIIIDTSSNMMTGSQLRKEKEEFIQLYQLEVVLRKGKESIGGYSSGVVTSKMYREEITDEK